MNKIDGFDIIKNLKAAFAETLQSRLEEGEVFSPLPERLDETELLKIAKKHGFKSSAHQAKSDEQEDKLDAFRGELASHKDVTHKKTGEYTETFTHKHTGAKVSFHHRFGNTGRPMFKHHLNEGVVFEDVLEEHVRQDATDADFVNMTDIEKEIVLRLKETGRMCGGDQGAYADGVLEITFKNKQGASDYMDILEDDDDIVGYEVEATVENLPLGLDAAAEVDFDDVMFDGNFEFDVIVYIRPDVVQYEPVEVELTDDNGDGMSDQEVDETAVMMEIKRRIKVNFRGKRRVKMQCLPGYKYNPDAKVCEKITGAEVAHNRISHRRAVRTRRAKGNGFKVRVARKSRKAKRFRKSMGLHEAVHPDTQAAWNDHFKKKDAQEVANKAKREQEAEAAKKKGSQSNKAKD